MDGNVGNSTDQVLSAFFLVLGYDHLRETRDVLFDGVFFLVQVVFLQRARFWVVVARFEDERLAVCAVIRFTG